MASNHQNHQNHLNDPNDLNQQTDLATLYFEFSVNHSLSKCIKRATINRDHFGEKELLTDVK